MKTLPRAKRGFGVWLLLAWLALGTGVVGARDGTGNQQTAEGEGKARIIAHNRVTARERALQRAITDALRGELVRLGIKAPAASQLSLARRYERGYRVLSERREADDFIVRVAVTIDSGLATALLYGSSAKGPGQAAAARRPEARLVVDSRTVTAPIVAAVGRLGFDLKLRAHSPVCVLEAKSRWSKAAGVRGLDLEASRVSLELTLKDASGRLLRSARAVAEGYGQTPDGARAMATRRAVNEALGPLLMHELLPPPAAAGARVVLEGLSSYRQLRAICKAIESAAARCVLRKLASKVAWIEVSGRPLDVVLNLLATHAFSGFSVALVSKGPALARLSVRGL